MKNFLTVFALMVSVSGVAVSLAREEVRCYLGLSSTACQANQSPSHTPKADSSSSSTDKSSTSSSSEPLEVEREEKPPLKLPTSVEELTKVGKDIINPSSSSESDSSSEITNPPTQAEEPPTAPPEVSQQPTEGTQEVSSPSTEVQPITEPVELEVIPPPEDAANNSETTQN